MHHLLNTQSDQFRNFDFHQTVKYEILLMTRTEQILMTCKGIIKKNYSKLIHFFTTFSISKLLVLIIDPIFNTANLFKTLFRYKIEM